MLRFDPTNGRYQLASPKTKYKFEERRCCPACGCAHSGGLYSSPFDEGPIGAFIRNYYKVDPELLSGAPYELRRCTNCSLVYQRFVGGSKLLGELYGSWIEDHCRPGHDPQYASELAHPLQSRDGHEILVAAAFLGLKADRLVTLDYGMGWALWARIALSLGCASYGSDLASSRMRHARAHGVRTIDDEEIGEPRFHFINTEQVMEHLANPRGTGTRLASALLPGGILKVSVPSAERADEIVDLLKSAPVGTPPLPRARLMPVQPLEHVNGFTPHSLEFLADKLGLELVEPGTSIKYAFLRRKGALSLARPMKCVKELVRPHYQFHNSRNLYVWMQKPLASPGTSG